MGSLLTSRDQVVRRRKGLQPCPLVIGARDDSFAGDPCYRGVHVRGRGGDPSPRPSRQDHRRRADRAGGGPGSDGDALRSSVPGPGGKTAARLVSPAAGPNAVQPSLAATRRGWRSCSCKSPSCSPRAAIADGTLISCANYPGCASKSAFAGDAAYGYCPSKSQFIWGMRLVLVSDPKGVPVGYDLVGPTTGEERQPSSTAPPPTPAASCSATRGLWGASAAPDEPGARRSRACDG